MDSVVHHVEKDKILQVIPPTVKLELFNEVHSGKLVGHLRDAKMQCATGGQV